MRKDKNSQIVNFTSCQNLYDQWCGKGMQKKKKIQIGEARENTLPKHTNTHTHAHKAHTYIHTQKQAYNLHIHNTYTHKQS